MNSPAPDACAACARLELAPHLRVAGSAGEQGLIPTTGRFGTTLGDIVRRPTRGHMQLDRMPSDAQLTEAYAEAESWDYVGEEAGQRTTARPVLEHIERHVERGRLLDLGCWVGFLFAEARDRGWQTIGVEPSVFASRHARQVLGLEVITTDLFSGEIGRGHFQAVMLGDVIEHLPRPGDALERAASQLAPGGVICLLLPDPGSVVARLMRARWWSVIPTHVQYFTRRSVSTMLNRHDFEVVSMGTAPKAFSVAYYLGRVSGYSPLAGRALVRAAERAGVAGRMWAPDLRDRMEVIARA